MAVIIFGVRDYGVVDAYQGEYASTRFFHLWFVPLVPTGSDWHIGAAGHSTKMYGKSVAAGYLRVWGAFAGFANLVAGMQTAHVAHFLVAAVAAALCAWSWSWRSLRGDAARRRSDFNFVAFGTRCEPRRMSAEMRLAAKRDLDRRWHELEPDRTPHDVALHGARDAHEAVIAYGLLRLAEDGDADRILAGAHVPVEPTDGPYRATQPAAANPASSLGDLVAARVAASPALVVSKDDLERMAKRRVRNQRLGLVCLTLLGAGGLAAFSANTRDTVEPTLGELRSAKPPVGHPVRITCDAVHGPVWEETGRNGSVTSQIAVCELGKYLLPVKLDDDAAIPEREITGRLSWINDRHVWVKDGLRKSPDLDNRSLEVYVDADRDDKVAGYVGLLFALATPIAWALYFWSRRRAKRATSS